MTLVINISGSNEYHDINIKATIEPDKKSIMTRKEQDNYKGKVADALYSALQSLGFSALEIKIS